VACFQALFEYLKQKDQTEKKEQKKKNKNKKQKLYNKKGGKNRLFMQGARDGSKPAVKPVS